MRKILFIILVILLLIFTGCVIYKGTNIVNANVWGITQISQKNKEIDLKNEELSGLISVTYPGSLSKLNTSSEELQQTKKEYEQQAIMLADNKYYKQTEKYKIEFLWTRLGNYAKDNGVEIKIDVTNGDTTGIYNLNFIITGKYSDIADFIYDIENDSRLGFKIENFEMASAGESVEGKFTCKDIRIDIKALDKDNKEDGYSQNENTNTLIDTNISAQSENSTQANNTTTENTTVDNTAATQTTDATTTNSTTATNTIQ